MQLPEDIEAGDYFFYVVVKYNGKIAIGSESFKVINYMDIFGMPFSFETVIVMSSIILITFLIILFIKNRRFERIIMDSEKIEDERFFNLSVRNLKDKWFI